MNEKLYHVSTKKKLNNTTVFNIDTNKKCFFDCQSNILEWFLKDYVTLKNGVMAAKNSALPLEEYIIF